MRYYDEKNRKNKASAYAYVAVTAYLLTLGTLFFYVDFSFDRKKISQIPQEGILISVGDIDEGLGKELSVAQGGFNEQKQIEKEEALLDDEGVVEPIPAKSLNRKALYNANSTKKAGSSGNSTPKKNKGVKYSQALTNNFNKEGFSLSGRNIVGSLPSPRYLSDSQGKVVVDIQVNQEGKVILASYRANKSTTNDAKLVEESLDAARRTVFNIDRNAKFIQTGIITYIFNVN